MALDNFSARVIVDVKNKVFYIEDLTDYSSQNPANMPHDSISGIIRATFTGSGNNVFYNNTDFLNADLNRSDGNKSSEIPMLLDSSGNIVAGTYHFQYQSRVQYDYITPITAMANNTSFEITYAGSLLDNVFNGGDSFSIINNSDPLNNQTYTNGATATNTAGSTWLITLFSGLFNSANVSGSVVFPVNILSSIDIGTVDLNEDKINISNVAKVDLSYDCNAFTFSSKDSSTINLTDLNRLVIDQVLKYPTNTETVIADLTSSVTTQGQTLTSPNLYTQWWTSRITLNAFYNLTNALSVGSALVLITNTDVDTRYVACGLELCDLDDCINNLKESLKKSYDSGHYDKVHKESHYLNIITANISLIYSARLCGNDEDVHQYIEDIKSNLELAGFDCDCGCDNEQNSVQVN